MFDDLDDMPIDELEELFDLYRTKNKAWKSKKKKTEISSIELRKILSLIMKKAKIRRKEIQEYRYEREHKKFILEGLKNRNGQLYK